MKRPSLLPWMRWAAADKLLSSSALALTAASVAGVFKKAKEGYFPENKTGKDIDIVCVLTGHGLKDPDRAIKSVEKPPIVEATLKAVVEAAGL